MKSSAKQKAALDRFLADNPELEQLSARLATFNVFRALKIERQEIRHSNTLGWLLDPSESHGLGDVFLRRIMSNMLLGTSVRGLTAAKVELMTFGDVEVRREWRHIDVLVIDRGNRLAILIENKVGCGEGKGQLARYRQIVLQEFPRFKLVPVFLTLEGDSTEDEDAGDFICYDYGQLLGVLQGIFDQRGSQMPEAVAAFLAQYIATLRRLTMQDTKLTELCRTIYRRHREAIDLIKEHGGMSLFNQVATDIIERDGGCENLNSSNSNLWFLPAPWARAVPENGTAWHHLKRNVGVACWFEQLEKRNRARLIFEVSRMSDPKLRLSCVKALRGAGFKLTKMAFNKDAKYSRFYTSSQSVSDWTNEEELTEALTTLFAKAKEQFPKVEAVLKKVFKGVK